MDNESAAKPAEISEVRGRPFEKGDDPRRNKKGRPRIPKTAKALQALLLEIAAEELTNPSSGESIDRLRLMLRGMFTSKQHADKEHLLDRLYGKVPQPVDVTSGGEKLQAVTVIEIIKTKDELI